jgi:hypothetical protein
MDVNARIVSEARLPWKIRNVTNSHFSAPRAAGGPPGAYLVLVADPSRTPPPGETPTPVTPNGLSAVTGTGPRPEPLDPPMVPFAVGGMVAFALAGLVVWLAGGPDEWLWICLSGLVAFTVAGLVLLLFRERLAQHGHTDWLWICVAGFLVGLVGLATMMRHDAHRRRRRALTHPEFRYHPDPVARPDPRGNDRPGA